MVAHNPQVAAEMKAARRARIAAIEADAQRRADQLDAQDQGQRSRGRRATDRGAYLRFVEAVKEAGLSRILKPDLKSDVSVRRSPLMQRDGVPAMGYPSRSFQFIGSRLSTSRLSVVGRRSRTSVR